MNPTIEAVMEANKNLNKKIGELEKECKALYWLKEQYQRMEKDRAELIKSLDTKRKVAMVVGGYPDENISYVLQIISADDTPDGMYIKVLLDKPNSKDSL